MLVIYPFSTVDQEQALKNAKWIAELGEYKTHDMLVMCDRRCDPDIMREVVETFASVFRIAKHRLTTSDVDGWPEGANQLFSLATTLIQHEQSWPYFLWLEPDAIPMVPGWLDTLEAEYKRGRKPFMGDRVQVGDIPLHMSGVGIYQNPIYLLAGECYRAHDTAWDMAAKDQIVPKAHFTNLIEHAWKHPTFKDQFELNTQIAKETILFHSSKDGSLIDLLRQKAAPVLNHNSVPTEPTSGSPSREEIGTRAVQPTVQHSEGVMMRDGKIEHAPIYDIFIRTYPGDYEWLKYCLRSINKFAQGFRKIWIITPSNEIPTWPNDPVKPGTIPIEWKVMNDETEDGYLAQQITKLYADTITDYQPDFILHVDSDVIFTRPVTPGDFLNQNKVTWYYTPYDAITTPWQPIIEKFMAFPQPYEFMRRLPMMVPRFLYAKLREFAYHLHGIPIGNYIKNQPMRAFSEFNAMGAFGYFNHPDQFNWVNTTTVKMPEPFARQFHSWSGLTPEVKAEINTILGGMEESQDAPSVPSQIKVLPSGVWVLHGDQISDWVIQEGRLDHDQNLLPDILKHINPGDTVLDAGAFIGDHTVAYSHAVGEKGWVIAFEPNPIARKCLQHNLKKHHNVTLMDYGLSDQHEHVPLSGNNGNYGGCYVGDGQQLATVEMYALDTRELSKVDFFKIDVEGYELKVLRGAKNTIEKCKPKMVIEINSEALKRQGSMPFDVTMWLTSHGYEWSIIQTNAQWSDPLFDILCLPTQPPETSQGSEFAHTTRHSDPSPVVPTIKEEVEWHIGVLKQFCETSPQTKGLVMQKLVYAGLRKSNKETQYAKTHKQTHRKRKSPFD